MIAHLALLAWAAAPPRRPPPEEALQPGCVRADVRLATPVPVPFRPLSQQEVIDRLDGVPCFSVVGRSREMVPTTGEDGVLACPFYLDASAARRALAELQRANPLTPLTLAATPLGTAFALSEWSPSAAAAASPDEGASAEDAPREREGVYDRLRTAVRSDGGSSSTAGTAGGRVAGAAATAAVELRLVACEEEVRSVSELLEQSPTPPMLRRANRRRGPVPLFGSDELRFKAPADEGAGADGGEAEELTPLFLRRSDFRAAWLASGGSDDALPAAQVSDLRSLAWQMECESAFDWRRRETHSREGGPIPRGRANAPTHLVHRHRSIVLVAPQDSIDLALELQQQQQQEQASDAPRRKRSEVQRDLFPPDTGVVGGFPR